MRQRSAVDGCAAMKFHQARQSGNVFTGYGADYVSINGIRVQRNVLVLAEDLRDWDVASFDALSVETFQRLAELPIEILLLGTGARLRFPHPGLTQPLAAAGIGLEAMATDAACRTYNILRSEDRKVAAALLVGA